MTDKPKQDMTKDNMPDEIFASLNANSLGHDLYGIWDESKGGTSYTLTETVKADKEAMGLAFNMSIGSIRDDHKSAINDKRQELIDAVDKVIHESCDAAGIAYRATRIKIDVIKLIERVMC